MLRNLPSKLWAPSIVEFSIDYDMSAVRNLSDNFYDKFALPGLIPPR